MKTVSGLLMAACLVGWTGVAFCESNPLAVGAEKITKAPFSWLKGGNERLFTPVKEVDRGALDLTDHARAAAVSVGLNFGKPVEEK